MIEFKPGLFGIEIPQNFGIFIKSYKKKSSKTRVIELFTIKGSKETKQSNIIKKNLGESIQLKGSNLPPSKEMNNQLKLIINRLNSRTEKLKKIDETVGKLTERDLWKKLLKAKSYESEKTYSIEDMAFNWYGLEISEISRNRLKNIREILDNSKSKGQGYFDIESKNPPKWHPITEDQQKAVGKEISQLGALRNKLFHMIEVLIEDSDDPEETEFVRAPKSWNDIVLTSKDEMLIQKLQEIMAYFVENDSWVNIGMGGTHIFALDGFSIRAFISSLAEDYVNDGKTSYADAFVKMLIQTGYWNDTKALKIISKRIIKLAPNFEWETEDRIENIAKKYKEPKETPEIFENRIDLQHLDFYTIDPPTAKDFDDAIVVEEKDEDYILWVAIADVAHYVTKDSSLDLHARSRATSVYLPTKTLPMLPTHLSDNLCSLNADLQRLAMTVEIHFDKKGNKLLNKCKVHNSVILVRKNLTYDFVNEAIENEKTPFSTYHQIALLLQTHRKGLKLETDDVRLELGGRMAVTIKTSSKATKMIETFMVAANETIAELLQEKKLPVVYRNHPLPDKPDVDRFNTQAKVIGLDYEIILPNISVDEKEESILDILSSGKKGDIGGNISFTIGGGGGSDFVDQLKEQMRDEEENNQISAGGSTIKGLAQLTPEQQQLFLSPFRSVLNLVEKMNKIDEQKLGYLIVLRMLSRALYSAGNFGHFGLGSAAYLHFTSPIRRYPDIIAHRVCKSMLAGQDPPYTFEEIEDIGQHCTEQSEIAEKLERTIVGSGFSFLTRNPEYTENRQGTVASIAGGGVFVLLPNGIEARIPLSQLTGRSVYVDDHGSMAFIGYKSTDHIAEEISPENWRELLQGDDDEPVEIITKLGDKIAVNFVSWNHVEGKVGASPISIEDTIS